RPGREEQRGRRPVVDGAFTELKRPQAVDAQHLMVACPELADELESPVHLRFESADFTVAEVANEQIAAEASEACRSDGDPPRRVQLPVRRDAAEEGPARTEPVDETVSLPGHVVLALGALLRVRDHDRSADVLDA